MSIDGGRAVSDPRPLGRGSADTGTEVAVKMFAEHIDKNTRAGWGDERVALEPLRVLRFLLLAERLAWLVPGWQ